MCLHALTKPFFFFSFLHIRDSEESSKIEMDPTRDSSNPYVGLAFKLEVCTLNFFSWLLPSLSEGWGPSCFFPPRLLSLTGRAVRSADLHPGLPGLSEERRIHLQHANGKKSPGSEARAPPCRSDGGEGEPRLSGISQGAVYFHLRCAD